MRTLNDAMPMKINAIRTAMSNRIQNTAHTGYKVTKAITIDD